MKSISFIILFLFTATVTADIIKNVRIFNDISSIEDQVFTGGFSEWKPAFDDYVQVIAEQFRLKLESKFGNFSQYIPYLYRDQIVAGVNYQILINCGPLDALITVYESLPQEGRKLTLISFDIILNFEEQSFNYFKSILPAIYSEQTYSEWKVADSDVQDFLDKFREEIENELQIKSSNFTATEFRVASLYFGSKKIQIKVNYGAIKLLVTIMNVAESPMFNKLLEVSVKAIMFKF